MMLRRLGRGLRRRMFLRLRGRSWRFSRHRSRFQRRFGGRLGRRRLSWRVEVLGVQCQRVLIVVLRQLRLWRFDFYLGFLGRWLRLRFVVVMLIDATQMRPRLARRKVV